MRPKPSQVDYLHVQPGLGADELGDEAGERRLVAGVVAVLHGLEVLLDRRPLRLLVARLAAVEVGQHPHRVDVQQRLVALVPAAGGGDEVRPEPEHRPAVRSFGRGACVEMW